MVGDRKANKGKDRAHTRPSKQLGKRHRSDDDADEDNELNGTELTKLHKSARAPEIAQNVAQISPEKTSPTLPLRRSSRLQDKRKYTKQSIPTASTLEGTKASKPAIRQRKSRARPQKAVERAESSDKRKHKPSTDKVDEEAESRHQGNEDIEQPEGLAKTKPYGQAVAEARPHEVAPRPAVTRDTPFVPPRKRRHIENWLTDPDASLHDSVEYRLDGLEEASEMPPKHSKLVLEEGDVTTSKSFFHARPTQPKYRKYLMKRNIEILHTKLSEEKMQGVRQMLSSDSDPPKISEASISTFMAKFGKLAVRGEQEVFRAFDSSLLMPALAGYDPDLESLAGNKWSDTVAIPTRRGTSAITLAVPKPDLAVGYPTSVFTNDQETSFDLLNAEVEYLQKSFSAPDPELIFPFFGIELKSQATHGSLHVAVNQAANTGSVAMNGYLQLMRLANDLQGFAYDLPQYFSITMDQQAAYVYAHWLEPRESALNDGTTHHYYMAELSSHFLNKPSDVKALIETVKCIFHWGRDKRLPEVQKALTAIACKAVQDSAVPDPQPAANAILPDLPEEHTAASFEHSGID